MSEILILPEIDSFLPAAALPCGARDVTDYAFLALVQGAVAAHRREAPLMPLTDSAPPDARASVPADLPADDNPVPRFLVPNPMAKGLERLLLADAGGAVPVTPSFPAHRPAARTGNRGEDADAPDTGGVARATVDLVPWLQACPPEVARSEMDVAEEPVPAGEHTTVTPTMASSRDGRAAAPAAFAIPLPSGEDMPITTHVDGMRELPPAPMFAPQPSQEPASLAPEGIIADSSAAVAYEGTRAGALRSPLPATPVARIAPQIRDTQAAGVARTDHPQVELTIPSPPSPEPSAAGQGTRETPVQPVAADARQVPVVAVKPENGASLPDLLTARIIPDRIAGAAPAVKDTLPARETAVPVTAEMPARDPLTASPAMPVRSEAEPVAVLVAARGASPAAPPPAMPSVAPLPVADALAPISTPPLPGAESPASPAEVTQPGTPLPPVHLRGDVPVESIRTDPLSTRQVGEPTVSRPAPLAPLTPQYVVQEPVDGKIVMQASAHDLTPEEPSQIVTVPTAVDARPRPVPVREDAARAERTPVAEPPRVMHAEDAVPSLTRRAAAELPEVREAAASSPRVAVSPMTPETVVESDVTPILSTRTPRIAAPALARLDVSVPTPAPQARISAPVETAAGGIFPAHGADGVGEAEAAMVTPSDRAATLPRQESRPAHADAPTPRPALPREGMPPEPGSAPVELRASSRPSSPPATPVANSPEIVTARESAPATTLLPALPAEKVSPVMPPPIAPVVDAATPHHRAAMLPADVPPATRAEFMPAAPSRSIEIAPTTLPVSPQRLTIPAIAGRTMGTAMEQEEPRFGRAGHGFEEMEALREAVTPFPHIARSEAAETAPSRAVMPGEELHRHERAQALIAQIATSAKGMPREAQREITVRLDPPELGEVHLRVITQPGGEMTARISTAHPIVRELLDAALPELRQSLAQAGVQVNQCTVSLQMQANDGRHHPGFPAHQGGEAPAFSHAEPTEPQPEMTAPPRAVLPRGAVDFFA